MEIRQYKPSDAPAVSHLVRTTLLVSNAKDYPAERINALHAYFTPEKIQQLADERYCLVAEIDGQIVATGATEDDEIMTFFVLPDFQHRGVGRQLIAHLERQAIERGLPSLKVPPSRTAVRFYEKMGYVNCGTKYHVKQLIGSR